jgi:phospholipid/cholesterol/gamma-HCH transport system substrate-binding protein
MSKEIKVGLFGLVTILMGYFGFKYLKGLDLFSSANDYYMVYDNVEGLKRSNLVMFNGVVVGRVEDVTALVSPNVVLVRINVKRGIPLTSKSMGVLYDESLLGGKAIRIELQQGGKILEDQDTLKGSKEVSLATLLKERALPVVQNADSLISTLNRVVGQFKNTGKHLDNMLLAANQTIGKTGSAINETVSENRGNLKLLSANIQTLTADLVQTQRQLPVLLNKFSTIGDSLNALRVGTMLNKVDKAMGSLQQILKGIEQGQGTLGQLSKNDSLYRSLNQTMVDLDKLFVDLKLQPKRYVHFSLFGKKDKPQTKE